MKITSHYEGQCFVVPCGDGSKTIEWLIEKTMHRIAKLQGVSDKMNDLSKMQARLHQTHGILMKDDKIFEVLDDNALVYIESVMSNGAPGYVLKALGSSTCPVASQDIELDGNSLKTQDLVKLGKGELRIKLSSKAKDGVEKSRKFLNSIIAENKVVYGVNTGFGKFARVVIPNDKLRELQQNLIRSHAACVGEPLSLERSRSLLALRINVLAKGYSGISLENLEKMVSIFNSGCISLVPEKGTVGASGDLAPLAHLALGMMGEGQMWGPKTGWADAATVLSAHSLKPIVLGAKEGLSCINGTQMIVALGSEALEKATAISRQADVVAALSFEVLKGTTKAFSKEIHDVRPHEGQKLVAARMRSLLHSEVYKSEIAESHRFCNRVQDAYTLRCVPQVHGVVHDTIKFVRNILSVEVNSATDNPLVFCDVGEVMSGGNFHGEYPAKALDYLAIGVHELANMSERRLERLINPAYSELPAFLTKDGGVQSGFMIAHCTAASLVSENKVLTHPSSVDSISTSAGTEDHVSMGGFAARKSITVVEHVEYVLAIELLAACQGIEFLRPLKTTEPLEAVYRLVRSVVQAYDKDRFMAPDINAAVKLLREEQVWKVVEPYIVNYKNQTLDSKYVLGGDFICPGSPTGYSVPHSPESHCPKSSNDSEPVSKVPNKA